MTKSDQVRHFIKLLHLRLTSLTYFCQGQSKIQPKERFEVYRVTLIQPHQKNLLFVASLLWSFSCLAVPVVQKKDRLELDWGNLKLRFYGVYTPTKDEHSTVESSTAKAINEGLSYAKKAIEQNYSEFLNQKNRPDNGNKKSPNEETKNAGESLVRASYQYHIEYFANGAVKVHFESALQKMYQSDSLTVFKAPSPVPVEEGNGFSGLVLRSNKAIEPSPFLKIIDESGNVLFSAADMDKEAFKKNFMGRWLINPKREELTKIVGAKPVSLTVTHDSQGSFVVQRVAWAEAMQDSRSALVNGRIAVVLPE
jgi:hypothetical protein